MAGQGQLLDTLWHFAYLLNLKKYSNVDLMNLIHLSQILLFSVITNHKLGEGFSFMTTPLYSAAHKVGLRDPLDLLRTNFHHKITKISI